MRPSAIREFCPKVKVEQNIVIKIVSSTTWFIFSPLKVRVCSVFSSMYQTSSSSYCQKPFQYLRKKNVQRNCQLGKFDGHKNIVLMFDDCKPDCQYRQQIQGVHHYQSRVQSHNTLSMSQLSSKKCFLLYFAV